MNQDTRNRVAETIIVVTLIVGAWFLLAMPMHERARAAEAELTRLEPEAAALDAQRTPDPERSRTHERRVRTLLQVAAPRTPLEVHERVLSLAERHDLHVERVNPARRQDQTSIGPFRLSQRSIRLEARGRFADVAAFLSSVSADAPMVVLEHFALATPEHEQPEIVNVSASLRVGGIALEKPRAEERSP